MNKDLDNSTLERESTSPALPVNSATTLTRVTTATYVGPLPPAAEFQKYNAITPGAGDRILTMAEKEQQHRHEMERLLFEAEITDGIKERAENKRGQWMAWSIALVMIAVGAFLIYTGHPIIGSLLSGVTLLGVISAFLYNPRKTAHIPEQIDNSTAKHPDIDNQPKRSSQKALKQKNSKK